MRLEGAAENFTNTATRIRFNSKLVRLEVRLRNRRGRFNSKLVRLKVDDLFNEDGDFQFQFQTGSIKSITGYYPKNDNSMFQFQTGSIKS